MNAQHLLPGHASALEKAISLSTDSFARLDAGLAAIPGMKVRNPPARMLPFLVYEYGLGDLTPYVPNLYDLISDGIKWQRVRGTPAAVSRGLGWVGYSATIKLAPTRRRYWNTFDLRLDRVRDDEADLPRIEGITGLSVPVRSDLWRGVFGYDVPAAEADEQKFDGSAWEDDSGVRLPGGKTKWSFGRRFESVYTVTPADLAAHGIEDAWALTLNGEPLTLGGEPLRFVPAGGQGVRWGGPWLAVPWLSSEVFNASAAALQATGNGPAWAAFKDASGEVLFYRRCRVRRPVVAAPEGVYRIAGGRFDPAAGAATSLYLEALTDFGEGFGGEAASVGFILSAQPAAGLKPGVQHLRPGELVPAGPVIGEFSVPLKFGRTVRDCVALLLRF